jgi:Holliday junction resolvasome RuvABC endonuclease subunit
MSNFAQFNEGDGTGTIDVHRPDPIVVNRSGRYLVWDPSLTACGWVLMYPLGNEITFLDSGVIRCEFEVTTQLGKMEAANVVGYEAEQVFRQHAIDGVVMESPPFPRPGLRGTDAPMIAAVAIFTAARLVHPNATIELMVTQKPKVRLTGDKKASKAKIRKAIDYLYPDLKDSLRVRVEGVYDAIAIGLTIIETPVKKA